jgi:hypothetical protein
VKEYFKLKSVKPAQTLFGAKPEKTSPILNAGHDSVIRQSAIIPVMPEIIGSSTRH